MKPELDCSNNKNASIARHSAKRKRFKAKMSALMSRVEPVPIDVNSTFINSDTDCNPKSRHVFSIYDLLGDEVNHQKLRNNTNNNVYSQQLLSQTQSVVYSGATADNIEPLCIPSCTKSNIGIESSFKILKQTLYPVSNGYQDDNTGSLTTTLSTNPYQLTLISIAKEIMNQNIKYSTEPQLTYKLDKICGIKLN